MTLKTIPIRINLIDPDGSLAAGAAVTATLVNAVNLAPAFDTDTGDGVLVPAVVRGTADNAGSLLMQLWPNALGSRGTAYRVEATLSGTQLLTGFISVPDSAPGVEVPIESLFNIPPYPAIDAAQQAVADAQAAAIDAKAGVIGEIRYLSVPPADPAWLKCDGKPYLRTAYPAYEAIRPRAALSAEKITTVGFRVFRLNWNGTYFIAVEGLDFYRSMDGITWETISSLPTSFDALSTVYANPASGAITIIDFYSSNYVHSTDHGVTWSTGILPGTRSSYCFWLMPVKSGGVLFTVCSATSNAAVSSDDGATWSLVTIPGPARFWEGLVDAGITYTDVMFTSPSAPGSVFEYGWGSFSEYIGWPAQVLGDHGGPVVVRNPNLQKSVRFSSQGSPTVIYDEVLYATTTKDYSDFGVKAIENAYISDVFLSVGITGDMLVIDGSGECERISGFAPIGSGIFVTQAASNGVVALFHGINYSLANINSIMRVTLNPLKFNAPGLTAKAGATPYVYTGA